MLLGLLKSILLLATVLASNKVASCMGALTLSQPTSMECAVESISEQTEALSVCDYNPDAVPYEVATLALS